MLNPLSRCHANTNLVLYLRYVAATPANIEDGDLISTVGAVSYCCKSFHLVSSIFPSFHICGGPGYTSGRIDKLTQI